MNVIH